MNKLYNRIISRIENYIRDGMEIKDAVDKAGMEYNLSDEKIKYFYERFGLKKKESD